MQIKLNLVSRLIVELLSEHSPEYGARLKQRLNVALIKQGLESFNEKDYGCSRFKNFLQKHLSAEIVIECPSDVGDIQVRLRSKPVLAANPEGVSVATHQDVPVIRSDIWQAFLQPDEARKRYYNKSSGSLVHFVPGQAPSIEDVVKEDYEQFVEILPLDPTMQMKWMQSFLHDAMLSSSEKQAIEALLTGSYSSVMNAMFTRALGDCGVAWRNVRTRLIHEKIFEWCKVHSIPNDYLYSTTKKVELSATVTRVQNTALSAHQQAIRILESMSEDDITKIVMPILVTTIYVKARL